MVYIFFWGGGCPLSGYLARLLIPTREMSLSHEDSASPHVRSLVHVPVRVVQGFGNDLDMISTGERKRRICTCFPVKLRTDKPARVPSVGRQLALPGVYKPGQVFHKWTIRPQRDQHPEMSLGPEFSNSRKCNGS